MATAPATGRSAKLTLAIGFHEEGDAKDVISIVPTMIKVVYNPDGEGEESPLRLLESHLRRYISEMERDNMRPRPKEYSRLIFPLGPIGDGLCLRLTTDKAFRHCECLHRRISPPDEPLFIVAVFNGVVQ